jgi:diacylglycerol kinase family enzyme
MSHATAAGPRSAGPPLASRLAAAGALVVSAATLVAVVLLAVDHVASLVIALVASALGLSATWIAATNRRSRWWAAPAGVLLVGVALAGLVTAGRGAAAVVVVLAGVGIASLLASAALRWEVRADLSRRWREVPPARHGVVIMNPKSGGGKATSRHLADQARRRGVEPVVISAGEDLRALAEAAVANGADALGMAGGDGSQAVVAAVAAAHGVPFVCVPAGTRNHFALDLGIDRNDPVRALDAFGPAVAATIDLAEVNGDVFVNNVSLGVYGRIVASDEYRDAKRQTVARMLPDLLGPDATPFAFEVEGPAGPIEGAQIIEVSNNPYTLSSVTGFGSRARLDTGRLGVTALTVGRALDVNRLVALELAGHPERFEGWREWTAPELEVQGPGAMAGAIDGEARVFEPPVRFAIRPAALEVRAARGQRGASPAFLQAPVRASSLVGLARVACGRPSGILPGETGSDE